MSAFAVFAICLTIGLLLYYAIILALDIHKLGKKKKSDHQEAFDISAMKKEDEETAVHIPVESDTPDETQSQSEHIEAPVESNGGDSEEPVKPAPQVTVSEIIANAEKKLDEVEVQSPLAMNAKFYCQRALATNRAQQGRLFRT